jgi:alkylation response protein AidB-like acyl-CoA dehydrogenase
MREALDHPEIREAIARLCARFPGEYWRRLDESRAYPTEFVEALTRAGYLATLIPEEHGGAGLTLSAAAAILEEIQRAGCNGGACHAQMYVMGTLLRHGSEAQKARYLPKLAAGELRLQAFGVTEPGERHRHGLDPHFARRDGDHYVINGQKIWTSRAEHSDLMVLARPHHAAKSRWPGARTAFPVFILDMREALADGLTIRPIRTMMNHATTEILPRRRCACRPGT